MMRTYLLCILAIYFPLCLKAADVDTQTTEVSQRLSELQEVYKGMSTADEYKLFMKRIEMLDLAILKCYRQHVASLSPPSKQNGYRLPSEITCREWPDQIAPEPLAKLFASDDRPIRILYRKIVFNKKTLYLAINTVRLGSNTARMFPAYYSLIVSKDEVLTVDVDQMYDSCIGNTSCLLDLQLIEGTPVAYVLSGPTGSGHFAKLFMYKYNIESTKWSCTTLLEMNGVTSFKYNPEKRQFSYRGLTYQKEYSKSILTDVEYSLVDPNLPSKTTQPQLGSAGGDFENETSPGAGIAPEEGAASVENQPDLPSKTAQVESGSEGIDFESEQSLDAGVAPKEGAAEGNDQPRSVE